MTRLIKQLMFGGIYLAIILALLWGIYRVLVPAPTCFDGIQNGGEEGVDCGATSCGVLCAAPIQPLQVPETLILKAGDGYDVLAHLENPNPLYGASRADYVLMVTDSAGGELVRRTGSTYVNPAQPRYLLFPLSGTDGVPAKAELRIDDTLVQWGTLTVEAKGDIQFGVRNEQFDASGDRIRYRADVLNRSTFDFDTVDVTVLLLDVQGNVVSANTTVQRTLKAGEEREFITEWPFAVPDAVRAQSIVTTNVFANDNFIRTYGSQERFQEF